MKQESCIRYLLSFNEDEIKILMRALNNFRSNCVDDNSYKTVDTVIRRLEKII